MKEVFECRSYITGSVWKTFNNEKDAIKYASVYGLQVWKCGRRIF